ncbi:hypothetical protein EDD11_005593 [Mortierella claussenii]|nr:hypothetical protein EDD11_005593 [Mortierella claussenii]
MSSHQVQTGPQQPIEALSSGTPEEHRNWTLNRKAGKEHVTFPAFVTRFKFYNRTDAHHAYNNLLNCGRMNKQRKRRIRLKYEHFEKNLDDLFWSRRLKDKSTEIVVHDVSVKVQEAGLKQVDLNIQRYLNTFGSKKPKTDGRYRDGATATEVSEDDMESMISQNGATFVERDELGGVEEPEVTKETDGLVDGVSLADKEGFQDAEPFMATEGTEGDEMAQFGSYTKDAADSEGDAMNDELFDDGDILEELQDIEEIIASGQSPFLPLLEHVYKKVQGQDTVLPPVPSSFICQEYKELYQYVYNGLTSAEQDKGKGKDKSKGKSRCKNRDKGRAYHVDKEVLMTLSGIVNTISPSTQAFTFTSAIKADSLVVALDEKDVALTELMNELLEAYCPGHEEDPLAPLNVSSLRIKIWGQLAALGATTSATRNMRQRMAVLLVVDYICTLISTNQLALPVTEHVIISVWSFILTVLLREVRGIPGELAYPAAKDIRLHAESEYGVTTEPVRGRKVAISVRVFANNHWDNEICIFEISPGAASDMICAEQQLKTMRLNAFILYELELKGVDTCKHYPIIAEGRGLCLNLYTLKRNGNFITAGKSINSVIWIPTDVVQLKQFLKSDSMQILMKFADHMARYAVHVQETLSTPLSPLLSTSPLLLTSPPQYKKPFAAFATSKRSNRKRTKEADEGQDTVEDNLE